MLRLLDGLLQVRNVVIDCRKPFLDGTYLAAV
jgi:hypothetical protein